MLDLTTTTKGYDVTAVIGRNDNGSPELDRKSKEIVYNMSVIANNGDVDHNPHVPIIKDQTSNVNLMGIVRDCISIAQPVVQTSFNIAKWSTDKGFAFGKSAIRIPVNGAKYFGIDVNPQNFDSLLDMTNDIIHNSLHVSSEITRYSLSATDVALSSTGAQTGEMVRSLSAYLEGQRHLNDLDDFHLKEALLNLLILLGEHLFHEMLTIKPTTILESVKLLGDLQAKYEFKKIKYSRTIQQEHKMTKKELEDVKLFMNFSAFAYGYLCLSAMGVNIQIFDPKQVPLQDQYKNKPFLDDEEKLLYAMTGIKRSDIIHHVHTSELYRQGHYVALHHESKRVVICIRGSVRVQDILCDLVCDSVEFTTLEDREGGNVINGKAHKGMFKSAQRLANDLHELIHEILTINSDYSLVVTGHSLGAGVASLLTLLWARMPFFRNHNIHCFAYAAPCCLCTNLSQSPFAKRYITSVVLGNDIVSTLSLNTFQHFQKSVCVVAPILKYSNKEQMSIYSQLHEVHLEEDTNDYVDFDNEEYDCHKPQMYSTRMYCPGRVIWVADDDVVKPYRAGLEASTPFPSSSSSSSASLPSSSISSSSSSTTSSYFLIDPRQHLNYIRITPSMFSIHLPHQYITSLKLLKVT